MRTLIMMGIVVAAHVAVLAAAFVMRAPEPPQTTEVVQVLVGHVDESTGGFEATGVFSARVAKRN
jgi:hypothetical protein